MHLNNCSTCTHTFLKITLYANLSDIPFLFTLAQKFRTHITLGVTLCVTCETCCLNGILFWRWFEDLNEKGTLHSVFLPRAWEDFFFRSCCCLYSSLTNFEFLHKNLDWFGHFLKKSTITLVRLKKGIVTKGQLISNVVLVSSFRPK